MTATPAHFDLVEAEKRMRAEVAAFAELVMPEDATERDRQYVHLQKDLQEMNIQFSLWFLRARNACADPEVVLAAFGQVLGNMLFEFGRNCGSDVAETADAIMQSAAEAIADLEAAHAGEGSDSACVVSSIDIQSQKGGRA